MNILPSSRLLVHFSCGAASAVAWKITAMRFGASHQVEAVYCDLSKDEHPDNKRFLSDVETWVGSKVTILSNPRYSCVDDVFLGERFMVSAFGAPCTKLMKRQPADKYSKPTDVHVFGMTVEESKRAAAFELRNPEKAVFWPLIAGRVTKQECIDVLASSGIVIPEMYRLGYRNNNCIGCVKGGKGYWNKIRVDFPDVFARKAAIQREIGARFGGKNGFMLDELSPDDGRDQDGLDMECGLLCESSSQLLSELGQPEHPVIGGGTP